MNKRNVLVDFGINGCYLARRWENIENWIHITKKAGYKYLEFDSDCLDPFFSGDKKYQLRTAELVKKMAESEDLIITDYYTGVATHRFHGLSHSNQGVRDSMKKWMVEAMDIAIALGPRKIGGHFDAFSVEALADEQRYKRQLETTYETLLDVTKIGKEKGIEALYLEQMYTPSEIPWTLDQADEYLNRINSENTGCPVYLTVDVGHAAGGNYGLTGDSLYYEEWLKRFAAACEVIHLQQTTRDASMHWPFTKKYNESGDIELQSVIDCIIWSHENYHKQKWSKFMQPSGQNILILEVIPSSTLEESELINQLEESSNYLKKYIPDGGLVLTL